MLIEVNRVIGELIGVYQENPLDFLYEADLQAWLFSRLRQAIPITISIGSSVLPRETFKDHTSLCTSLVHTEYSTRLFDIAIIDPRLVQSTEEYKREHGTDQLNEAIWDQRVAVAIEVKHWIIGYPAKRFLEGLQSDIQKLRSYQPYYEKAARGDRFVGIACLFVQSFSPQIPNKLKTSGLLRLSEWSGEIAPGISGLIITPSARYQVSDEI